MKVPSQCLRSQITGRKSGKYAPWFALAFAAVGISMAPDRIFAETSLPNAVPFGQPTAFVEGTVDYDGDGRIGAAENADGDNIFSSIAAVPGFDQPGGITGPRTIYNHVIIVSSGVFPVNIRPTNGVALDYTIEAAAGVVAVFDPNNVDPPPDAATVTVTTSVTLRNLTFRNISDIVRVNAGGTLLVENCCFEDCGGGYAIVIAPNARAVVSNSTITRCGDRQTGQSGGIRVVPGADVIVSNCTITGNFGAGVVRRDKRLRLLNTLVAHNNPNFLD